MAIASDVVTVATTAVLLSGSDADSVSGQVLYLTNSTADVAVYLGDSDVTSDTGFPLAGSTSFPWPLVLGSGEALYAISATSADVQVLRTGV